MRFYWGLNATLLVEEPDGQNAAKRAEIRRVLQLSQEYIDQLDRWAEWLVGPLPNLVPTSSSVGCKISRTLASNAEGLLLFNVIESLKSHAGQSGIPSWEVIQRHLDIDEENPICGRYSHFKELYSSHQRKIKKSAEKLVATIQNNSFIEEFDLQPWTEQLNILADISQRLAESDTGRRFLLSQLADEDGEWPTLVEPEYVPVFHPIRIEALATGSCWGTPVHNFSSPPALFDELATNNPSFYSAGHVQQAVTNSVLQIAINLLPLSISLPFAKFSTYLIRWIKLLTNEPYIVQFAPGPTDALAVIFQRLEDWRSSKIVPLGGFLEALSYKLRAIIGLVILIVMIEKLSSNPSAAALAEITNALANLSREIMELIRYQCYPVGAPSYSVVARFPFAIGALRAIGGVYKYIQAVVGGFNAFERRNWCMLTGHVLMGTAGLIGMYVGIMTIIGPKAAELFPGIVILAPELAVGLIVSALVLEIIGLVLIHSNALPILEAWIRMSFFGKAWDGVQALTGPEDITYRWKELNGTPRISRQIMECMSLVYPLIVEDTQDKWMAIRSQDVVKVTVRLNPTFVRADWKLVINAIENNNIEKIVDVKVGETNINSPFIPSNPLILPESLPPDGLIEEWFAVLHFEEDRVPEALEVIVLPYSIAPNDQTTIYHNILERSMDIDVLPASLVVRKIIGDY